MSKVPFEIIQALIDSAGLDALHVTKIEIDTRSVTFTVATNQSFEASEADIKFPICTHRHEVQA